MEDVLIHVGVGHEDGGHSGRYPWGSGENPGQHQPSTFMNDYRALKEKGLNEGQIAEQFGVSQNRLRTLVSNASQQEKAMLITRAKALYDEGMSLTDIAKEIGSKDSTVRNWIKTYDERKLNKNVQTANVLRDLMDKHKYLDVGVGVAQELGVTQHVLDSALTILETEGYKTVDIFVPQVTNPSNSTIAKILVPEGVERKDVLQNQMEIGGVSEFRSDDNGDTFRSFQRPTAIDSSRVMIKYAEEGGINKDGVIELRRGVPDLDLGLSHYAQVRINVDDTHYLKGMAVYADDLPDGVDIRFNTNKELGTDKMKVLKPLKRGLDGEVDWTNPFGATIAAAGQSEYADKDGNKHLSAINKVNDEGAWGEWSKTVSSQFLSKQNYPLVKRQLDLTYAQKLDEFEEIKSIPVPEIKKFFLEKFASDCDSSAVELKATGFQNQASHVILPVDSLKPTEIYAPGYKDGSKVCLIRYPHAGTFEIPELVVNNKNQEARKMIGTSVSDAVGINHVVAEQLSGADFDGDTVTVIPTNNRVKISTSKPLEELKNFDPKIEYREYDGMPKTCAENGFMKQTEMGKVSNLITDMTLIGAPPQDIARAVKHSMVVIDAEKHNLDWRRSEKDNEIAQLNLKYRGRANAGASTVISKAKGRADVTREKDIRGISERNVDPETGKKLHILDPDIYVDKATGKTKERKVQTTKMEATDDAFTLLSDNPNPKEVAYATFANQMKDLGNQARKEYLATPSSRVTLSAKETYAQERAEVSAALNNAQKNAPKERLAQIRANQRIKAKREANPNMDKDELKKVRQMELNAARAEVGSVSRRDRNISLTQKQMQAISAGAFSGSFLMEMLNYVDTDALRKQVTPRNNVTLTDSKINLIKSYANSGRTQAEIAEALGLSKGTVSSVLSKKNN